MASKRLTLLERYLERVLLGAAGVFAFVLLVLYGFQSPNRVEYEGRPVGPGELETAIRYSAERLHESVATAIAPKLRLCDYHTTLAEGHAAGILCGSSRNGIMLAAGLPRSVGFGTPIPDLPPVDPDHDIRLVSPLPPSSLVLTSGRAVVRRITAPAAVRSQGVQSVGEHPVEEGEAVFWVSVGGLFDPAAQREAFRQARYPAFRAGWRRRRGGTTPGAPGRRAILRLAGGRTHRGLQTARDSRPGTTAHRRGPQPACSASRARTN